MTEEKPLETGVTQDAVRGLKLDQAFELNDAYEQAAGRVKSRTWTITTWVLTLEAALMAFGAQLYTEQLGDSGFLLLQLAIALVGIALGAFLVFFIVDQGQHLKGYWISQRKLAIWNTALGGLVLTKSEESAPPDFGVTFPPFCTRLIWLVALFAAGFAGLFAMMAYLAGMQQPAGPYQRAILDAAVIEPHEIETLPPLRGIPDQCPSAPSGPE